MSETIYQIYDKMFKKILTLSSTAVINLINGLFGTNHPADSTITYNWTEFEDQELKRTLADTILTVNWIFSYHIEAQMTIDEDIVFRVFEYGYGHADRNSLKMDHRHILRFPEPKIIYFCTSGKIPEYYILELDFGSQGAFSYKVPTFNYLSTTPEELTERKMVILIPFELLKLREAMKKERTPENLEALKSLIQNDILGSINENLRVGNITMDDARRLKRLTQKLYDHIYAHYEELEEISEMTDESLMLDIDIIEKQHEQELARKDEMIARRDAEITEKDNVIAEKNVVISEKDTMIAEIMAEKDQEIAFLKKRLAEITR